jgi:hypothetical protein
MDMSISDGGSEAAVLMQLHVKLSEGLQSKGLSLPTRYRPGQQLSPKLLDSSFEILQSVIQSGDQSFSNVSNDALRQVIDEALSVGALTALIENESVQKICLNGAHHLVYYSGNQSGGGIGQQTKMSVVPSPFSSVEQAHRAASRILNGLGAGHKSMDLVEPSEGKLGDLKAFVDLYHSEGPHLCLQRPVNKESLSAWVESGRFDAQMASTVTSALRSGSKVGVVAKSSRAQAEITSAIALSCLRSQRMVSVGMSHHIGNESSWVSLGADNDALALASRFTPECIIIEDQAALNGAFVLENLSAASSGLLLVTARSSQAALKKLQRRGLNDDLVTEALDLIVNVKQDANGVTQLSEVYDVIQRELIYSVD